MNPTIPTEAIGYLLGQIELFSLSMANGLEEGKR